MHINFVTRKVTTSRNPTVVDNESKSVNIGRFLTSGAEKYLQTIQEAEGMQYYRRLNKKQWKMIKKYLIFAIRYGKIWYH